MALQKTNATTPSKSPSKLHEYEESAESLGGFSPSGSATEKHHKIKKLTIDHLCVDVPTDAMLREMFEHFDVDGSGAIEIKEFRTIFKDSFDNYGAPMEDRDVDRLFAKFDKGGKNQGIAGDGKLHYDEFCVLILSRLRM